MKQFVIAASMLIATPALADAVPYAEVGAWRIFTPDANDDSTFCMAKTTYGDITFTFSVDSKSGVHHYVLNSPRWRSLNAKDSVWLNFTFRQGGGDAGKYNSSAKTMDGDHDNDPGMIWTDPHSDFHSAFVTADSLWIGNADNGTTVANLNLDGTFAANDKATECAQSLLRRR